LTTKILDARVHCAVLKVRAGVDPSAARTRRLLTPGRSSRGRSLLPRRPQGGRRSGLRRRVPQTILRQARTFRTQQRVEAPGPVPRPGPRPVETGAVLGSAHSAECHHRCSTLERHRGTVAHEMALDPSGRRARR
jgi:hypothetical protein